MTLAYKFPTITGTASDRTGGTWTNLPAGWLFIESDTFRAYYWNASTWNLITTATVTETLTGKTLTTPTLTTPTLNGEVNAVLNKTSNYTLLATDRVITADASGGAFTLTLPTAVGATAVYTIKRTDILASSNLLTIATTSSQTIDGAANHYLWPAEFVVVQSDNANWQIVNRSQPSLVFYHMLKGTTADKRVTAGDYQIYANSFLTSTTSPALNTLWAIPFPLPKTTKFDTISFRLTTNSTAGNSRLGIYRDTGNMYPGALIFDSGAIDTTSGAGAAPVTKNSTITSGVQVFPAGLYWLAYEQDTATGQMLVLDTSSRIFGLLGHGNAITASAYGYSVAHTFGALPDPYTASATQLNAQPSVSNPVPAIGLRPI